MVPKELLDVRPAAAARMLPCALLLVVALLLVAPVQAQAASSPCPRSVGGVDLAQTAIDELRGAMRDGRLTSAQLVGAYTRRIEPYDGYLEVVLRVNSRAAATARKLDADRRAGRERSALRRLCSSP